MPGADDSAEFALQRLRESYTEVLQATKHEDDKIGRFLATIAFIVAGALLFVEPAVLSARYELRDGTVLPLPAFALLGFLVFVLLAVLFYVLSTAAPVIRPPNRKGGPTQRRQNEAVDRSGSLLFFLEIAEYDPEAWPRRWLDGEKPRHSGSLRKELIRCYVHETWNLAARTDMKRRRSQEGSVLFTVALLFFGLAVGWAIDIYGRAELWSEPGFSALAEPLPWTNTLSIGTGAGLTVFVLATSYLFLRREQTRYPTASCWHRRVAMVTLPIFIGTALAGPDSFAWRLALGLLALVAAVAAGLGLGARSVGPSSKPKESLRGPGPVVGGLIGSLWGVVACVAQVQAAESVLLGLVVVGAVSPLYPTLAESIVERSKRASRRGGDDVTSDPQTTGPQREPDPGANR